MPLLTMTSMSAFLIKDKGVAGKKPDIASAIKLRKLGLVAAMVAVM